jgi:beta-carotene 15,15'-dioxygenase
MAELYIPRFIGAASPPKLRLWTLPFVTIGLILLDRLWSGFDNGQATAIAALAIVLTGIPHGTLDIEIAATRFGRSRTSSKLLIGLAYVSCAALMMLLWVQMAEMALAIFLVISIVHFSSDWRGKVEPFLAMMVGWAIIGLPALSHPQQVADIFATLTGNQNGAIIAQLLACASVPAALGTAVFAFGAYQRTEYAIAIDVITCMVASIFLPPLIAFAVFFCGLHSPRHMADALNETGALTFEKKAIIVAAVSALSIGFGVLVFIGQGAGSVDANIIRTSFVVLSILTVPHFILEQVIASKMARTAGNFDN